MRFKNILLSTLLLSALTYSSCTVDSSSDSTDYIASSALSTDEVTNTLKRDNAIEDIAILINDQFEAKIGASTSPATPPATYTSLLPANTDVTYVDSTPPTAPTTTIRTITITFGTNNATCIFRGHTLKGEIIFVHTFTTSTTKDALVTFNNFSHNGNTVEGKGTWNRTMIATPASHPKNTLTMTDVKFTTSDGAYDCNGWNAREMTSGYTTRTDLTDDVNAVNVSYVTVNPLGFQLSTFTINILATPLILNTSCSLASTPMTFAGQGTIFITKGNHSAIIKFGTGGCDNDCKLAIDLKLQKYFNNGALPTTYNSALYAIVPVTTPPTTPPTNAQIIAKFDAEFDAMAIPFTLNNN